MNIFILVISIWGYTGTEWEYIGNQAVYQKPMTRVECKSVINNWKKFEDNEFYRISLDCISAKESGLLL